MKNCNTRFTGGISSGFTLIELIVVIVILGILAVSAAPKFMDLQGDARAATLKGMMGAVKSANSLILGKAVLHGTNTKYSDRAEHTEWKPDCSTDNCVNIGQMWVYLKYAYIDRNSVAFIIDSDISGKDTKEVTNSKTNQKIIVPARNTGKGEVQESCTSAKNDTICEGHDFCQCRLDKDYSVPHDDAVNRDSQVIVPRGFPYNVSKHPGGGCYFKYTSAEKANGKIEPVYTLVTSGC